MTSKYCEKLNDILQQPLNEKKFDSVTFLINLLVEMKYKHKNNSSNIKKYLILSITLIEQKNR